MKVKNKEPYSNPNFLWTVKDIMKRYKISRYAIYHAIKTDPTFPLVKLGPKKCYRVNYIRFEEWLSRRSNDSAITPFPVLTGEELLKRIEK